VSDKLVVRLYNVRFGDAILVIVPDRDPRTKKVSTKRILIDVGNAPLVASAEGGDDAVFQPVIEHILKELDGEPLDLYVMTHEHLDHVQGLPHAAWKLPPKGKFLDKLKVEWVWLTASAAPKYYETHPDAKKKKLEFEAMYSRIRSHLAADATPLAASLWAYLRNNDAASTTQCVDFLRKLNPKRTAYVYRGAKIKGKHPFKEATLDVWAPEEDTSTYYGRFQPLTASSATTRSRTVNAEALAEPPPGVDVGAFLNLLAARRNGISDNMLAIDQAANNTSVVFALEWRGWRLLFPGDAEVRSWKTMQQQGVLKPVHFLKVAHHGSHNGTPDDDILELVLPKKSPDKRKRVAAISTWTETYSGIPHTATNTRLKSRCDLKTTLDDKGKLFYEVVFDG
jgi:beta-lactamase superfamily II metal-dependent hydrolase